MREARGGFNKDLVACEDFEVAFFDHGAADDEVDLVEPADTADCGDGECGDVVEEGVGAEALIGFDEHLLSSGVGIGGEGVSDGSTVGITVCGIGLGEAAAGVSADGDGAGLSGAEVVGDAAHGEFDFRLCGGGGA